MSVIGDVNGFKTDPRLAFIKGDQQVVHVPHRKKVAAGSLWWVCMFFSCACVGSLLPSNRTKT